MLLPGQDSWELIVSREFINKIIIGYGLSRLSLGWCFHGSPGKQQINIDIGYTYLSRTKLELELENNRMEEMMREYFCIDSLEVTPSDEGNENGRALKILCQTSRRI